MGKKLPLVDEHSVYIEADTQAVWRSLVGNFGASQPGFFGAYAALIGCRPREVDGPLDRVGSTRIGFRVAKAQAPTELVLTGEHAFSRYSLTWSIEPSGERGSRLSARTDALFPGFHGKAYRTLVIASGAHAAITRKMLGAVARGSREVSS